MTQKVVALGIVIGLTVAVIAAAGYQLLFAPDADLTNLLVGGVLTQFGIGVKAVFDKIST